MLNEHEIRERIHLASLELLGVGRTVNTIHSNLLMRRFAKIKVLIIPLIRQLEEFAKLVPEETDE